MTYQSPDEIKSRIDFGTGDFYDHNKQKQFDDLLERLELEARGLIETRSGDETFAREEGRVDEKRATDDAALLLVYPIQDVQKVEIKQTMRSDWRTLDEYRYDHTDHRLILSDRVGARSLTLGRRDNPLKRNTRRATWRDLAEKVRVTYDRGFDPIPGDIKSVQIDIIRAALRNLRTEQNLSAMEPDQVQSVIESNVVLTDDIRERIDQITGLGGKTMSI